MPTHTFIPMLGKRLRAIETDECGAITTGVSREVVTDGFITVNLSSEVEDGTEIIQRLASGALCVNEKMADSFKRFNVEVEFCGVNPDMLSIVSNAEPYLDYAGDIAGFTVGEGELTKSFALELWMGMSGQACAPGQTGVASAYMLLPWIQSGVLGDITIDGENAVTFSISGAYTKGGNQWGTGPHNVVYNDATPTPVASKLPTAIDPFDHLLLIDTALTYPPVANTAVPVPALVP